MDTNLCQYSDIFGAPNTGLHQYRFLGIALVDTGLTIIFAYLIARYLKYSFFFVLFLLIILSLFLHRMFCVKTTLTKLVWN